MPSPFETPRARVAFGARSVDRRSGAAGAIAIVATGARYPQAYHVTTHGRTPVEVATEIAATEARHAVKEQKIDNLRDAVGAEFAIGDHLFRITDATVITHGANPSLVLQIARQQQGEWRRMSGMPVRKVFGSIDLVPHAAETITMAIEIASAWVAAKQAHEQFAADVLALLAE